MMTLLLVSAAILGTLAFFEPCTIATHTLFAARTRREPGGPCCKCLLQVWLARSVLVTLPLLALNVLVPTPDWSPQVVALILTMMGAVYLLSRSVYLPIPHLELYKLLPGGRQWPDAVRLGLTLPACTLPLYVVVAGLSVINGSLPAALFAGLLFATLFTLPTAWYGLALLLAFAVGRSIPILLGAWSIGWLESLRVLGRYQRGFELLGGVVLIGAGFYLLNEYFMLVGY